MHPSVHAQSTPDKPALIVAETGETSAMPSSTAASNRAAQLFRARGLRDRRHGRVLPRERPRIFALTWGAQRSGLFYVCISSKLTAPEVEYIVRDSGAKLLVASAALGRCRERLRPMIGDRGTLMLGGAVDRAGRAGRTRVARTARHADRRRARRHRHALFVGHDRPAEGRARRAARGSRRSPRPTCWCSSPPGSTGSAPTRIYLSPAPLYHAAPLRWSMTVQRLGGTVVMMQHFDPRGGAGGDRDATASTPASGCRRISSACSSCPRRCARATTCRR